MIIIGVDYHPSDQYIAFVDTETGEYVERQLIHSAGCSPLPAFFLALVFRIGGRFCTAKASPHLLIQLRRCESQIQSATGNQYAAV
jgi:hypothetical protein